MKQLTALLTGANIPAGRLPWIDYARGIAIILVVYRHAVTGFINAGIPVDRYVFLVQEALYNIRMPMFFVISGLFVGRSLQKRGVKELIFNKFSTIMYPYLVWAFIQVSIQIVLSRFTNSDRTPADYLLILYAPRSVDQFWFLYALFNTALLYVAFRFLRPALHLPLAILLHFVADAWFHDIGLVRDALYFYLFFYIGHLLAGHIDTERVKQQLSSTRNALLALPFFVAGQWLWLQNDQMPALMALPIILIGTMFIVQMAFILQRNGRLKLLRAIGFHSMYIYMMHVLVVAGIRIILVKILGIEASYLLLAFSIGAGIFLPVGAYYLSMKAGLWFLYSPQRNIAGMG